MKAYAVVEETVSDETTFAAYRQGVMATLEPFGGRFIVRGGRLTVMEPHPDRPQQVASITPTLAQRPARRPWWSR